MRAGSDPGASIETFPLSRLSTFDVGIIGRRKHRMLGLLEVDVTDLRSRLRQLRREGSAVSFFACFVKSVASALREVPQVHGVRRGRRKRVVFQEVDIAVVVERRIQGTGVPVPLVIRRADELTVREINDIITEAQKQEIEGSQDFQLGHRRSALATGFYYRLPQFARVAIMKLMLRDPWIRKRNMGTVIVTSLGAGLRFPGWIVPETIHNLAFGIGAIVRKPRVVGDEIVARDVLHLTVMFDHDVVDGVPAGQFTSALVKLLESGAVVEQ